MTVRFFAFVVLFVLSFSQFANAQVAYSKKSETQMRIEDDVSETSLVVTRGDLIALEDTLKNLLSQAEDMKANFETAINAEIVSTTNILKQTELTAVKLKKDFEFDAVISNIRSRELDRQEALAKMDELGII